MTTNKIFKCFTYY